MKKKGSYYINEQKVPSCTQMLSVLAKNQLMYWAVNKSIETMQNGWKNGLSKTDFQLLLEEAKKAHIKEKQEAGYFGYVVHDLLEAEIGGQEPKPRDKDTKKILKNFKNVTEGWEWLASEIPLENEKLMYGGTADGLAKVNGSVHLVDFKTGSGVWPETSLQLAGYYLASPSDVSIVPDWNKRSTTCYVLHLNKENLTWQVLERDVLEHLEVIPSLRAVYDWVFNFTIKNQ